MQPVSTTEATGHAGGRALRGWQRRALVKYLTAQPRDFLAVATPATRSANVVFPAPGPRSGSMHGQLRELRRELDTLVSIAHHRTGKPHGWIHNELRRRCGRPPMAAATREQLKARIVAVRQLNSEHP
jgi:hypothetical protein